MTEADRAALYLRIVAFAERVVTRLEREKAATSQAEAPATKAPEPRA